MIIKKIRCVQDNLRPTKQQNIYQTVSFILDRDLSLGLGALDGLGDEFWILMDFFQHSQDKLISNFRGQPIDISFDVQELFTIPGIDKPGQHEQNFDDDR